MNIKKTIATGLGGAVLVGSGFIAAAAISPAEAAAPIRAGGFDRSELQERVNDLPPALREDVVALKGMEPQQRRSEILKIRDDIHAGKYGPEVDARVQELRNAFVEGGLSGLREEIRAGW